MLEHSRCIKLCAVLDALRRDLCLEGCNMDQQPVAAGQHGGWRLSWDGCGAQGSAVIRELEKRTTIKSCSTDEGGCGRRGPMQQSLEGQQPRAFALQLVWESLQEAGQDIRDTLELIQEVAAQPLPLTIWLQSKTPFPAVHSIPHST